MIRPPGVAQGVTVISEIMGNVDNLFKIYLNFVL